MDKKLIVSALIANALGIFTEDERESLMAMEEAPLESALARLNALAEKDAVAPAPVAEEAPAPAGTPTTEEYIAAAPPEIRDVLANSLAVHNAQKAELIATITANAANKFSSEYLATKPLPELQGLAALAAPATKPVTNGLYGVPMFAGQATLNAAAPVVNNASGGGLSLPTMTFEPAGA